MRLEKYKGLEQFPGVEIIYISKSINHAISLSIDKLFHLLTEIKNSSKIVLDSSENWKLYTVINKGNVIECHTLFPMDNYCIRMFFYPLQKHCVWDVTSEDPKFDILKKVGQASVFEELFLQYAEVETKVLESRCQIYEGQNCIYNNRTQFPIKIIDSTWFTTLIHSDAFKVRGHFRLQPCGQAFKDRKLIWINEFQKDGYTREAKILNQQV